MDFEQWWEKNQVDVCSYLLIQDRARMIWQASRENQGGNMDFEAWLKHIGYEHFAMQPAEVVKRALHMAWQASRENMDRCPKCGQQPPVLHCEQCGYSWGVETK